jgi:DNA ligase (NAD+)
MKAPFEEIDAIDGIGEKTAESVIQFFEKEENLKVVDKLRKAGLKFKEEETEVPSQVDERFKDKTFVFTGALEHFSRDEAKDAVEKRGGKVTSSVSRNTDYVVVGEEPGSKYEKAKDLNIRILTEKEFLQMLET